MLSPFDLPVPKRCRNATWTSKCTKPNMLFEQEYNSGHKNQPSGPKNNMHDIKTPENDYSIIDVT